MTDLGAPCSWASCVEDDRHRPAIHELDVHPAAKPSRRNHDPERAQRRGDRSQNDCASSGRAASLKLGRFRGPWRPNVSTGRLVRPGVV